MRPPVKPLQWFDICQQRLNTCTTAAHKNRIGLFDRTVLITAPLVSEASSPFITGQAYCALLFAV